MAIVVSTSSCNQEEKTVLNTPIQKSIVELGELDGNPTLAELESIGTITSLPSGQTPTYPNWPGEVYLYSDDQNSNVEVYVITTAVGLQDIEDLTGTGKCDRPVSYTTNTSTNTTVINCPNKVGSSCQVVVDGDDVTIILCDG